MREADNELAEPIWASSQVFHLAGPPFLQNSGSFLAPGDPPAGQESDVLHQTDHPTLDLLAPHSTPTGSLEAMLVGGLGKAAFHHVLAPFSARAGRRPHCQATLFVKQCLVVVANQGAAFLGCRAFFPQRTWRASWGLSDGINRLPFLGVFSAQG